jgi:hypothetical protein
MRGAPSPARASRSSRSTGSRGTATQTASAGAEGASGRARQPAARDSAAGGPRRDGAAQRRGAHLEEVGVLAAHPGRPCPAMRSSGADRNERRFICDAPCTRGARPLLDGGRAMLACGPRFVCGSHGGARRGGPPRRAAAAGARHAARCPLPAHLFLTSSLSRSSGWRCVTVRLTVPLPLAVILPRGRVVQVPDFRRATVRALSGLF